MSASPRLAAGCILLASLIGCAPPPAPVHVDLARAQAALASTTAQRPERWHLKDANIQGTATLKSTAELRWEALQRADLDEKRIRDDLETRRLADFQKLVRRLYAALAKESQRYERERLAELATSTEAVYARYEDRIRALLEQLGRDRSPKAIRIAWQAGHPDPNPTSSAPRRAMNPFEAKRFEERKRLRAEIAALDEEFLKALEQVLSEAGLEASEIAQAIRLDIERYRADNDRKAHEQARETLLEATVPLDLRLAHSSEIAKATTESSWQQSWQVEPVPSQVPYQKAPEPQVATRVALEGKLRLWAGLHRYRPTEAGSEVPDRTEEFIEWCKNKAVGP